MMKQRINSFVLIVVFSSLLIFGNCVYAQADTVIITGRSYPEGCVAATWKTDNYGSLTSYSNGGNSYYTNYQCVELYKRWVEKNLGLTYHPHNAKYLGEAIGNDPDYTVHWNGSTTKPIPGDALIWTNSGYGHVAIVTSVSGNTINFIQQNDWWTYNNTFHPTGYCTWNGSSFSNPNDNIDSSQYGKCWIHPIHPKKIGAGSVDSVPVVSKPGAGPALLGTGDGGLLLGWGGTDSAHHLNLASSYDGRSFTNANTLSDTSNNKISLAYFGSKTYMAWTSQDNRLNIMSSSDGGKTFANKVTLSDTSCSSPAIIASSDKLYLAWPGVNQHKLNVIQSTDGVNWNNKVTLENTSPYAPALAYSNGNIYLCWTGTGNNRLNIMRSTNGTSWTDKVTLSDTSFSSPTMTAFSNKLYLAWSGMDSKHTLNVLQSANGVNWNNKIKLEDASLCAPTLAYLSSENKIYLAWTGTNNNRLNVMSSTNGTSWTNKVTLNQTGN